MTTKKINTYYFYLILIVISTLFFSCYETAFAEENLCKTSAVQHSQGLSSNITRYGKSKLKSYDNRAALLYAYNQIRTGVKECKKTIKVSSSKYKLSEKEIQRVFQACLNDYPEFFWMNESYSYTTLKKNGEKYVTTIKPRYDCTGSALNNAKEEFIETKNSILSQVTGESQYEIELQIHDLLAKQTTYDLSADDRNGAYGALVNGEAVCEGYARAFQYLLNQCGIESYIALGYANNEAHAWNVVKIDGKWCHVDVTWDDNDTDAKETYHGYFNLSTKQISKTHQIKRNKVSLPKCTTMKYFYYKKNPNLNITEFNNEDTSLIYLVAEKIQHQGYADLYCSTVESSQIYNWYQNNCFFIAKTIGYNQNPICINISFKGNEYHLFISAK